MNVLVTGSEGFVGKNLLSNLIDNNLINPITFDRKESDFDLKKKIKSCEAIIHLAAVNRTKNLEEFEITNVNLTKKIIDILSDLKNNIPIIYISSIHDTTKTPYGLSKRKAINYLKNFSQKKKKSVLILRLARVFGKWSKPNYNSVVATFCNSIIYNKKFDLFNKNQNLNLTHIDDIISYIVKFLYLKKKKKFQIISNFKTYQITPKKLLLKLKYLHNKNSLLNLSDLANYDSLDKKLFSTYISFLPKNKIIQKLKFKKDRRGSFAEILKFSNDGQFSFFTCEPGEVRGKHFHNTKLEKFLVVSGVAEFRLRDLYKEKIIKFKLDERYPELVTSLPGYVHDIKNIGKKKLVVLVWANEVYQKNKPDTFFGEV